MSRSDVRLLVVKKNSGEIQHSNFEKIKNFLNRGDLLVFNSSRTLPASILGREVLSGNRIEVRLAEHLPDDQWLALLLGSGEPFEGMRIEFSSNLSCTLVSKDERIQELWRISFSQSGKKLMGLIYEIGRPIRYEYIPSPFPLDYYQNVYARQPGSSEMPSAGRAFTWKMLFDLRRAGIEMSDITLHTGLSSYMNDELDAKHTVSEEEFTISENAARKINITRSRQNRIIAVGTTVVRALESAVGKEGMTIAGHGYTRLHITKDHKLGTIDGLLTGLHEPEASHLDLLGAFLPEKFLYRAYKQAVGHRYLWHEFGDLNLIT